MDFIDFNLSQRVGLTWGASSVDQGLASATSAGLPEPKEDESSDGIREQLRLWHKQEEEARMRPKTNLACMFRMYLAVGGSSGHMPKPPRIIKSILNEPGFEDEAKLIRSALLEDLRLANEPRVTDVPDIDLLTKVTPFEHQGLILDLKGFSQPEPEISPLHKLLSRYNEIVVDHAPGATHSERAKLKVTEKEIFEIAEGKSPCGYKAMMEKFAKMLGTCPDLDASGEKHVLRTALLLDYALKYTAGAPRLEGFDDLTPQAAQHYRAIMADAKRTEKERQGFVDTLMIELEEQLLRDGESSSPDEEKNLAYLGEVRDLISQERFRKRAQAIKDELAESAENPKLKKLLDDYQPLTLQFGLNAETIRAAITDKNRIYQMVFDLSQFACTRSNIDYKRAAELMIILVNLGCMSTTKSAQN